MTILVCTDFTAAAAAGEREASRRFADARLVLFHAVDTRLVARIVHLSGMDETELARELAGFADMRLNEIIQRMHSEGRRAIADLVNGDPIEAALAAAGRHRVDLVVLGAPALEGKRSTGRFRAGLARRSRVPVLIIPG